MTTLLQDGIQSVSAVFAVIAQLCLLQCGQKVGYVSLQKPV